MLKSLVVGVKVDIAGRAHNCQSNSTHRILQGDTRLKVKNGRSWDHYCYECAKKIISRDIKRLTELQTLKASEATIFK